MQLGPGGDAAVDDELHLVPLLGDYGEPDGARRLHLLQHQLDCLGTVESGDLRDGVVLGRLVAT
jgi:hypothetical protein